MKIGITKFMIIAVVLVILFMVSGIILKPTKERNSIENKSNIDLVIGEDKNVKLQDKMEDKNVEWLSEDESIVTVSEEGIISAQGEGDTQVIAKTDNKEIRYHIVVRKRVGQQVSRKDKQSDNNKSIERADESSEKNKSEPSINKREVYIEDSPLIKVDSVLVKSGEKEANVNIKIKNNPGILGMTLSIHFDNKALKLMKVENGPAVKSVLKLTTSKELNNNSKFVWDGIEIKNEEVRDGTILSLFFKLDNDLKDGEYPIEINYEDGEIVDSDLIPIDVYVINGKIKIK